VYAECLSKIADTRVLGAVKPLTVDVADVIKFIIVRPTAKNLIDQSTRKRARYNTIILFSYKYFPLSITFLYFLIDFKN
jgi:hypothetical protein